MVAGNNSNGRPAVRRPRTWIIVGVLAAVAIIPVFTRPSPIKIHTATVRRGAIRSVISTNGKLEPFQNFEAHSPAATTVRHLFVREGDRVRRGQILLQLDDADLRSQAARAQAQLRAAQAEQADLNAGGTHEEALTLESQLLKARSARDSAQRNLSSLRSLQQQGSASSGEVKQADDALQRAEADVNLLEQKKKERYSQPEAAKVMAASAEAQAAYDAAQDALAKSTVRAPFDGIVYTLPVKQGAFVQNGDLLLEVGDLSKMLVRTYVDEPDIGHLAIGQKIEVSWDAIPSRIWDGTVSTVPSTVKLQSSRNVGEVTCTLDNHDLRLLPNIHVGVTIITAEQNDVLTLQRDAVRIDETKPYVYEVVNDRLERRYVDISLQNLTQVEITSGLRDGAVVALASAEARPDAKPLGDGVRVRVVP